MNQQEIDDLLESCKPKLKEALIEEMTKNITWDAKSKVINEVNSHVLEWTKKEIIPEITKLLIEEKDGILSAAKDLAPLMVAELTKAMVETLAGKLKSSWEREKIFGAMFK